MHSFRRVLTIVSVLVLAVVVGTAQPSAQQVAAERYARELARFLTVGDRTAYKKFVEENFGPEFLRLSMESHLGFFNSMHDQSRGLEVVDVQDWEPNGVVLLVTYRLTGLYDGLFVRVTPEVPYKIAGIGLRPPKAPLALQRKLSDKEIKAELSPFVKRLSDADVFSGAVLLARDGKVIYSNAAGMANKDFGVPNKLDTKFNLGSMNKMFTGVAIAQLVEKGKISYDDPLAKFIPDFPNAEAAKNIQIKHLLTHTSGLGGYFSRRYQEMSRETAYR